MWHSVWRKETLSLTRDIISDALKLDGVNNIGWLKYIESTLKTAGLHHLFVDPTTCWSISKKELKIHLLTYLQAKRQDSNLKLSVRAYHDVPSITSIDVNLTYLSFVTNLQHRYILVRF